MTIKEFLKELRQVREGVWVDDGLIRWGAFAAPDRACPLVQLHNHKKDVKLKLYEYGLAGAELGLSQMAIRHIVTASDHSHRASPWLRRRMLQALGLSEVSR